jgi:hypothetical protein
MFYEAGDGMSIAFFGGNVYFARYLAVILIDPRLYLTCYFSVVALAPPLNT